MTKKIWVVPIEPVDSRYTRQWYSHIPILIEKTANDNGQNVDIVIIDGEQVPPVPTPGAFLDFGATNIWKSTQMATIAEQIQHGKVKPYDVFLFTDAWNPTVLQLKYMSELLKIPVKIHGLWHAGSYDPADFLGRLIGDKPWVRHTEKAMFESYDTNWFASNFHMNMFVENLLLPFDKNQNGNFEAVKADYVGSKKIDITGWPMEYLYDILEPYSRLTKKKQIAFPHRIAPEKQLDIFKDLASQMPEYDWVVCQEKELTKHEYHTILGESTMVFSANMQETFGISMIEGLICGAIPLVPNRLSYQEMYEEAFKYPSEWTENFSSYESNREKLVQKIKAYMENYESNWVQGQMQVQLGLLNKYIRSNPLMNSLVL